MRYFIRAIGPQLKLVATPEQEGVARALAPKLAAAGLPVTQLDLS